MQRFWPILAAAVLVAACSRQSNPAPTPESQSDKAPASAPNGVGSQRNADGSPKPAGGAVAPTVPPSATGAQQSQDTTQSATSRSSADQQGVTASPPDK